VFDLADPDDGCLLAEGRVDVGGLDDYLTATAEFPGLNTDADHNMNPAVAVEADMNRAAGLSFVDSDTEGIQEAVDIQEQVVEPLPAMEQHLELDDEVNNEDQDNRSEVDPDLDDVTDYKADEPLDLDRMIQLLTEHRHRGGDFEGDDMAEDFDDAEAGPMEGVQMQAEEFPIEGHLAEPLWTTTDPGECRLKQLQVSV
jgi:hypothetical protein